jgi:hypothetical protein
VCYRAATARKRNDIHIDYRDRNPTTNSRAV